MEPRQTKDGSYTLYIPALDEHYHSFHGARTESEHVFIKNRLKYLSHRKEISLFELGFGTGYNALLTALESKGQRVKYHSLELYPVPSAVYHQLAEKDPFLKEHAALYLKIMDAEWETWVDISEAFSIYKEKKDFHTWEGQAASYDLFYYDAFGFRAQEDMWGTKHYQKIYDLAAQDAVLVTYAAKGIIRRGFEEVGFSSERLPGPPGKREMLRLTKN